MPTRRRWIAAPSALVALTALTACQGSEVTVESAPPSSATTAPGPSGSSPAPGTSSTPAPSSPAPTGSNPSSGAPSALDPAPNPITGSSISAAELGPTVSSAQNARISFRFELTGRDNQQAQGTARCSGKAAWTLRTGSREEIHVDGSDYSRTGSDGPYRQRSDDELELDDDNPCNFESVIDDDVTFQVVGRDASYDGRTGLTELRGNADGASFTVFLEPSRRPVHVQIKLSTSTRSITYRDYGAPVTITAPTDVRSGGPSPSSGAPV
ncbi:hypothetical protein FB554_1049 [Barrientosiimonas humi]|uniref:Lipoprotein n=2 Tax=Barrientosiimonas TaxID=1535207 RepID=A0A542XAY1_9MICO|nr:MULTISPECIES: hypothetical protein [Barrientosiimonas]TQL32916.1 hypothetical protein FB554_1049 [Barrientosiimonas humi]BDZ57751.1 hypothetical protein GCM10025872_14080 [Barrientosiimonas endolithica]CAG7572906.1 hypothetical protein BH39T_PBIAJDOK_01530 [Barrientosiimonas humi]